MNNKAVMACAAIIDILKIFADSEIGGQYEIDYDKIAEYLKSFRFASDYFDAKTKDEIYDKFTQDIYAGLPVWRFLILPTWTMNMIERSFANECQQEMALMRKTYKCLTCKYYSEQHTMIGVLPKCNYKPIGHSSIPKRKPFTLKKRCSQYERKI